MWPVSDAAYMQSLFKSLLSVTDIAVSPSPFHVVIYDSEDCPRLLWDCTVSANDQRACPVFGVSNFRGGGLDSLAPSSCTCDDDRHPLITLSVQLCVQQGDGRLSVTTSSDPSALADCCGCWSVVKIGVCYAVVSQGSGWGCVSEHGANTMLACYNELFPENVTGISDVDRCRQVMLFVAKQKFIICSCINNFMLCCTALRFVDVFK